MRKTNLMRRIEREYGRPLPEVIRRFRAQSMSKEQIAREFGVAYQTLAAWMKDIETAEGAAAP